MRTLLITVITIITLSCDDGDVKTLRFRVNHFQQPKYHTLGLLVQSNGNIEKDNWTYFSYPIEGFEYEAGFIYELIVEEEKYLFYDILSSRYTLKKIVSKSKVPDDTQFEINLMTVFKGYPYRMVTGDASSGFKILDTIEIDCNDLCNELNKMLEEDCSLSGLFTHTQTESIKLIELKKE